MPIDTLVAMILALSAGHGSSVQPPPTTQPAGAPICTNPVKAAASDGNDGNNMLEPMIAALMSGIMTTSPAPGSTPPSTATSPLPTSTPTTQPAGSPKIDPPAQPK